MSGRLSGLRVVNTRAAHQAEELDRQLEDRGALPVSYPCIAIVAPEETWDLDSALTALAEGRFDWLVLTSANTVQALEQRLSELERPITLKSGTKVAAVGPSTASAANRVFGAEPAFVAPVHTAEDLLKSLPLQRDESVLFPRSQIADPEVEQILRFRGARVRPVVAYRTVTGEGGLDVPGMVASGQIDALTFCSSSAVEGFVKRMDAEGGSVADAALLPAACIGPSTHATAQEHGFTAATQAYPHTIEGLVAALEETFAVQQGGSRWR